MQQDTRIDQVRSVDQFFRLFFVLTFQGKYMKPVSTLRNVVGAVLLSVSALGASAETILANPVAGSSFSDVVVGTITVSSLSDLTGSMFAASSINFTFPFPLTLTLGSVTFSSASVGSLGGDLDASAAGFSFKNVLAGSYLVKASGSVSGGQLPNFAVIGANYTVTPVPEPETFAMLLAGLGLMGAIARRRNKSAA